MIYDLNGTRVSMTNLDLELNGYRIIGAQGLKLSESLEPGEVEGTSSIPVGYTDGPWSGTGGVSAPLAEMLSALAFVGGSFGKAILTGTATFTALDSSDGVSTITINAARITKCDLDGGDRSKAAMIPIELKLLEPSDWNGVKIIDPPDLTNGAAGFVLSIFGG
jgi:hypothetical protein